MNKKWDPGIICFLILVLASACYSFMRPVYNWDMLGYVAVALSMEEPDLAKVHARTYHMVQSSIPADNYTSLIYAQDPFRQSMHHDPVAFSRQLYVYRLKPLYPVIMYGLYKTGISLVTASVLVSVVSAAVISLISLFWLSGYITARWSWAVSLLIGVFAGMPYLSRLSTPDAFSSALIISALYVLLEKRRPAAGIALLLLSIPARADNILFIVLVTPFFVFWSPSRNGLSRQSGWVLFLLAACVYLLVRQWSGTGGWWYQFNNAFLGEGGGLPGQTGPFSLSAYLSVLTLGLIRIFLDRGFLTVTPMIVLSGLAVYYWPAAQHCQTRFYKRLILLLILYIGVHFVLFPVMDDRFFAGQNLMIMISGIVIYSMRGQRPISKGIGEDGK